MSLVIWIIAALVLASVFACLNGDNWYDIFSGDQSGRAARIDADFKFHFYALAACVVGAFLYVVFKAAAEPPEPVLAESRPLVSAPQKASHKARVHHVPAHKK